MTTSSQDCLHCALLKAAEHWFKTHNASTEELEAMIVTACAQVMNMCPAHRDKDIEIHILGFAHRAKRQLH